MVVQVAPNGAGPGFAAAGNPIKMTDLPEPSTRDPAPALDGNRAAILRWLDDLDAEV
jgi:CoA:oxalate CoA-transferase